VEHCRQNQSTGSDHEIIVWEVIEKNQEGPSCKIAGCDLRVFKRSDGVLHYFENSDPDFSKEIIILKRLCTDGGNDSTPTFAISLT